MPTAVRCVYFCHKDQYFTKIYIKHHCKDRYLEICAVELKNKVYKLYEAGMELCQEILIKW
jgi:hypothetical protein